MGVKLGGGGSLAPLLEGNMKPGKQALNDAGAGAAKIVSDVGGNPRVTREAAKFANLLTEARDALNNAVPREERGSKESQVKAARAISALNTQANRLAASLATDGTQSDASRQRSIRSFRRKVVQPLFDAMRRVGFAVTSDTWKPPKISSTKKAKALE